MMYTYSACDGEIIPTQSLLEGSNTPLTVTVIIWSSASADFWLTSIPIYGFGFKQSPSFLLFRSRKSDIAV